MDLFLDYPLTTLFVLAVFLFVVVQIGRGMRRAANQRTCSRCHLLHPREARFCRKCGRELGTSAENV